MSQPNADFPVELEAAEAPAEMAVQQEEQVYRKQSLNVYTVMLLIAFIALIIAIILLAMNLSQWEGLPFPYNTSDADFTPKS